MRWDPQACRPVEVRKVASPVEAAAMLEALEEDDRRLWAVAFYSGLRRGELIGLRRGDIDLATGVIRVERGWDMFEGEIPPKSRQGKRKVPIPAVLRDYLDELLLDTDGGPLFGTPSWSRSPMSGCGMCGRRRTCRF